MALNSKPQDQPIEIKSDKVLIGPDRITRFERARIVGARALQLSMGAPILINIEKETTKSPLVIAEKELRAKVLPISIRRELPDKTFQIIPIQKLRDIQALREI